MSRSHLEFMQAYQKHHEAMHENNTANSGLPTGSSSSVGKGKHCGGGGVCACELALSCLCTAARMLCVLGALHTTLGAGLQALRPHVLSCTAPISPLATLSPRCALAPLRSRPAVLSPRRASKLARCRSSISSSSAVGMCDSRAMAGTFAPALRKGALERPRPEYELASKLQDVATLLHTGTRPCVVLPTTIAMPPSMPCRT
ncbi:hypothetical protein HWV62_26909 [Athelia sp. TMB]|nr:hypothetical protein HWV62_26909 [Athelia sp. TMB]